MGADAVGEPSVERDAKQCNGARERHAIANKQRRTPHNRHRNSDTTTMMALFSERREGPYFAVKRSLQDIPLG